VCNGLIYNVRYLGAFNFCSRSLKCCFDRAKQTCYRAFNSIYGKIGMTASEVVLISLIRAIGLGLCRHVYMFDACPGSTTDL